MRKAVLADTGPLYATLDPRDSQFRRAPLTAILSRRLGLPVWTYDRHFDLLRVEVWRGA